MLLHMVNAENGFLNGCTLLYFLLPCALSCLLVPFFRYIAHKTGIVDVPNGLLKVHAEPTAYLGGVAIYCATLVFYGFLPGFMASDQSSLWSYLIGMTILVVGGLMDDIFAISPLKKFMIQGFACLFFVSAGCIFKPSFLRWLFPFLSDFSALLSFLGVFFALWWMLAIINAINLIDIMDGLATSVSLCALWGMSILWGQYILFLPFLGILVGFFFYNKPKASIYLGDAGSLFLGGVLATLPFLFGWGDKAQWPALIGPFCILFIPIFELCSLMVIRSYLGIPFYYGSPHHFALFLKRRGWGVKKILRATGIIGIACSLFVLAISTNLSIFLHQVVILLLGAAFFLFFSF